MQARGYICTYITNIMHRYFTDTARRVLGQRSPEIPCNSSSQMQAGWATRRRRMSKQLIYPIRPHCRSPHRKESHFMATDMWCPKPPKGETLATLSLFKVLYSLKSQVKGRATQLRAIDHSAEARAGHLLETANFKVIPLIDAVLRMNPQIHESRSK